MKRPTWGRRSSGAPSRSRRATRLDGAPRGAVEGSLETQGAAWQSGADLDPPEIVRAPEVEGDGQSGAPSVPDTHRVSRLPSMARRASAEFSLALAVHPVLSIRRGGGVGVSTRSVYGPRPVQLR
jgi:hypothetical protein